MARKAHSKTSPLYRVTSDDATYVERISAGLVAMGYGEDESIAAAESTIKPNQRLTLIQGTKNAINALTAPTKLPKSKDGAAAGELATYEDRPGDYRRAISAAKQTGESVLSQMRTLGLVRRLDQLITLS